MFPNRHRQHRRPGFALALLIGQMAQVGFNNIPPVTLLTIIGQAVAFLRLPILNIRWPHISEVCISAVNVWFREDYGRIFWAALFHADEWHLYFNMVSFLWKGLTLEPKLGSTYFVYMLGVFTALTNIMYVALSLAAEQIFHDPSHLSTCAVGFSGVLFALKVVTTHMSPPGVQRFLGFIPVPSRYACWAELILIHIMVPRASFVGHLAGILVGLLYVYSPLGALMQGLITPNPSARNYAASNLWSNIFGSGRRRSTNRDWGSGQGGHSQTSHNNPNTGSTNNYLGNRDQTSHYTGGLSEEEQMQQAMRDSLRDYHSSRGTRPEPSAPPMDHSDDQHTPVEPYPPQNLNPNNLSTGRLYPNLNTVHQNPATPSVTSREVEDLRQRRLRKFDRT